jgi:predicted Zn-dependent peptidase
MSDCELIKLSNGMLVALVPCEAESVAFGLFVKSGSRHEPAKFGGISHFIEHMLFKGTPKRSPIEITRAVEGRGGNFNAFTSEESTGYYAQMPREYLAEAVDIIVDMYLNATIPETEFHREREVVLEEIKMYSDEPDAVAMENLQRALFPRSRLGAPVAGTEKTLRNLTPEDLKNYIARHYRPDNTVAVIAGCFGRDEAISILEKSFEHFRHSRVRECTSPVDFSVSTVPEVKVEKDILQTQIALGYRMFGADDERKYAASVLDALLGRGMSSRLFQEIREKRGLSYDISSRLHLFADAGMLSITAGVDSKKVDNTLLVIDREIKKLCSKKVSQAELKRTKEYLCGNFRISHERVTSKLFFYGSLLLSTRKLASPEEQVSRIMKVTSDDVISVAREIFTVNNRSLSIVASR